MRRLVRFYRNLSLEAKYTLKLIWPSALICALTLAGIYLVLFTASGEIPTTSILFGTLSFCILFGICGWYIYREYIPRVMEEEASPLRHRLQEEQITQTKRR